MADYVVSDTSLTGVADAIRERGGTNDPLAFPDGFETAIESIPHDQPTLKMGVIRPDAELVETWSYDKLWIADEGGTLPAYSTSAVTLKASEQLEVEHEWELDDYKYFVTARTLVIPFYNTDEIARGRVEWSETHGAWELVYPDSNAFRALVDPSKGYVSRALGWVASGGTFSRMPYFTNSQGTISVYSANSYGIWCTVQAPTYSSGEQRINSPNFTLRCQPNVFDKPFYEALTDIRFQWVIELWRVPVGSLNLIGWSANQQLDHILECVYGQDHKLT
jgi:hypothetical protein